MGDTIGQVTFGISIISVLILLFVYASTDAKRKLAVYLLAKADAAEAADVTYKASSDKFKAQLIHKDAVSTAMYAEEQS